MNTGRQCEHKNDFSGRLLAGFVDSLRLILLNFGLKCLHYLKGKRFADGGPRTPDRRFESRYTSLMLMYSHSYTQVPEKDLTAIRGLRV